MTTTRRSFIASTALATAGGVAAARMPLTRFTAPGEVTVRAASRIRS